MKGYQMSGRKDSAREALGRVQHLHPVHHEPILAELDRAGLLDEPKNAENGGKIHAAAADLPKRPLLTPMQAAEAKGGRNRDLLKSVMAQAKRLGFTIKENEHVDVVALDAAMAGKDVTQRLAIKSALAKLALIP
jgi:hypothetical protein